MSRWIRWSNAPQSEWCPDCQKRNCNCPCPDCSKRRDSSKCGILTDAFTDTSACFLPKGHEGPHDTHGGKLCPQCRRNVVSYPGAVYCGAACSAAAEMHIPPSVQLCWPPRTCGKCARCIELRGTPKSEDACCAPAPGRPGLLCRRLKGHQDTELNSESLRHKAWYDDHPEVETEWW